MYMKSILTPHLYSFTVKVKEHHPKMIIMEDNEPTHDKPYHDLPRARLGLTKLESPTNSTDLIPIVTIWSEMNDKIKD